MSATGYWQQALNRRLSRRSTMRALFCGSAGFVAAALIGCGNRRTSTRASGTTAVAAQPRPGGELHLWETADPYDFDSTYAGQSTTNTHGDDLAYESLLGFRYGPDVDPYDPTIVPRLAEGWESPDAQNYTFHLRKGVKFASLPPVNGRELTSADWKFSFEYNARLGDLSKLPAAFYAWQLGGIDRVDTPDDSTLAVRFKQPYAPFRNYSAGDRFQALPREIYDQYGNFHDHIAGTGPFQLDPASSQKGSRWVWKKNPTYWDAGKPYLDRITRLIISDTPTALTAFQVGQLDTLAISARLSSQDARIIRTNSPNAVIKPNVELAPLHLYMNVNRAPLDNVNVRRALSLSVDRDEFVNTFSDGKGLWAVPGAFPDVFAQDEIKKMPYLRLDVAQAKQLLSQAGYPSGIDLEFLINKAYGATYQAEAELLQAQWAKAGIRVKLNVLGDYADYLKRTRAGPGEDYQLTMRGKSLETDVDSYLFAIYHPDGGVEGGKPPYDQTLTPLVDAQRREADPAKRKALVRQACSYIADACWHLAIFRDVAYQVWQPYVKNLAVIWSDASADYAKNTWLDK